MKLKIFIFSAILLLSSCEQEAQDINTQEMAVIKPDLNILPMDLGTDSLPSLRTLFNPSFQDDLDRALRANSKWNRLINQKKMAVGLVDLSDPYHPVYARANGNVMMYAASLPKIAILLAVMDALDKGEIEDTPEIREKMQVMISKSSNEAATELMDLVGFEKIERVLTDPKYDLYDEDYGGGLWVGKRYAKTGARYPDPLRGISHGATVTQVCRYYYLMAYGQLITFDRSREMLELMADPKLHHKFVANLEKVAPNARLYRKSGTWKSYHADSVLVWGPERRYILVALIEDEDGERVLQNLVLVADNLLKSRSAYSQQ